MSLFNDNVQRSLSKTMWQLLEERFPSFEKTMWFDSCADVMHLRIVDSGGLVARERVSKDDMIDSEYQCIFAALNRLADVFETPSHWMAL